MRVALAMEQESRKFTLKNNREILTMARNKVKNSVTNPQKSGAGKKISGGVKTERWISALVIPAIVIVLLVCNARRDYSYSLTICPQKVSHKNVTIEKAFANSTDIARKNSGEIFSLSSQ